MKKQAIGLVILMSLTAALPAVASLSDEVKMTVDVIMENEDELVFGALALTPEQEKAFMPVWREYQAELDKVMANRISMLKEFMETRDAMSDDAAQAMIQKFFAQTEMKTELRKRYAEKFSSVLPAAKVVRLIQIENKIQALVDLKLAESIPLIK